MFKSYSQKSYLFEEESDIMITIAMKKTPEKQKTKPIRM